MSWLVYKFSSRHMTWKYHHFNVDVTSFRCIDVDKTEFLKVVCLLGYWLHTG